MPRMPPPFRPASGRLSEQDLQEREREQDRRRGSARARGYTSRWDKARASYLREHPLCVMCQREDRITAATVVDHKIPHRGDHRLFWDPSNWQSLCKPHHDGAKQREERAR